MAKSYKLPSRDQYPAGSVGEADRWQDYQRVREGLPPLLGREVTEADSEPEPLTDVDIPPLHELRISDPASYNEIRRAFANEVFAGHDSRAGGGKSPFNRNMGD
jgi:hypothetical protein